MSAVPHDPHNELVTAEEVRKYVHNLLREPVADLAAEAEILSQAHEIVHKALK
ncbi:hypothetical protein [Corynebacterium freiburgense]|uniref:hypothetical protein n=1 Tax=Corynebacterium freiburgense TaxID=556548 RepID=UPI0012EB3059|nr:hypothetical protein [Corynebacterium freiburgense]